MNEFQSHFQIINNLKYHYYDQGRGPFVLLLHGFPDCAFGWRFQINALTSKGFRVIAPDLVGYGSTAAPKELDRYGFKSISRDLIQLMDGLGCKTFYIGCHDWGGMLGWRMCQYYPQAIKAIVSFCTAFQPTNSKWIPPDELYEMLPNLAYQQIFAEPETQAILDENVDDLFDEMFFSVKDVEKEKELHPFIAAFRSERLHRQVDVSFHKAVFKKSTFFGPLNVTL